MEECNTSPPTNQQPTRKKIEKAILNKVKEIHGIKERLFTLRYDSTQPREDTIRDVEVSHGSFDSFLFL